MTRTSRTRLAGEVLAAYARAWWQLRRRPLPEVLATLRAAAAPLPAEDPVRLARAVTRVVRVLPTDSRCLVRSATLTGMLARRGLHGIVVLGVRGGDTFAAHAWVELEGRPLLPPGDFERLTEL